MNKHTTFKVKTQVRECARRIHQGAKHWGWAPPRRAPLPRQRDHR